MDIPFHRLHEMTKAEIEALGCKPFNTNKGGTLMLFPAPWFDSIPGDLKVTSITDETSPWSSRLRSRDRRWGVLAYGVRVK